MSRRIIILGELRDIRWFPCFLVLRLQHVLADAQKFPIVKLFYHGFTFFMFKLVVVSNGFLKFNRVEFR